MYLDNLNIIKVIPNINYSILIVGFVGSNNAKLLILFGSPDLEALMFPPIRRDTMSTLKKYHLQ